MKNKIIVFILLIISPFIVYSAKLGDVDGNGNIDIRDYGKIKMHLLNRPALTGEELKRANIDGVDGVNSRDLGLELQLVLGKDISAYISSTSNSTSAPSSTTAPTATNTPNLAPNIVPMLTARFIIRGKNVDVSCTKESNGCKVVVPNINIDNYITLGYSNSENSKKAEIKANDTITITSNVTYFGVISRELKGSFVIQDSKGVKASYTSKSCTIYNNESSCEIVAPKLTANNGYNAIGWNTDKNAKTSTLASNGKITISDNVNYYSISKNNTGLSAKFVIVTKAKKEGDNKICYRYNGESTCNITAPVLTPSSGYEIVGWAKSKTATTAQILSGSKGEISENTTFYSIVKQKIVVTFSENDNISNSKVAKSNIKAEKLSFYKTDCYSYNDNGCKITWVPTIYSTGNYVHGFSKTKNGDTIEVQKTVFKNNTTLYARVYNGYSDWKLKHINIQISKTYGNIVVEIQDTMSLDSLAYLTNFIDVAYAKFPQLFNFNGKVILLEKDLYTSFTTDNESSGGKTTGKNGYSLVYLPYSSTHSIRATSRSLIHELGHCYDRAFEQIFDKKISSRKVINDLFKKYSKEKSANRPLRDYSYGNIKEFVADIIAWGSYKYLIDNNIYYDNAKKTTYYILTKESNEISNDLYSQYSSIMKEGLDYYKKIGRIK